MDPRFSEESGVGIYTGNELLVKGALECGIGEITGYPGSPLAELFNTLAGIRELLEEFGIAAQIANNEALAAARLNGAQMASVKAMAVMKSVGMHVAADGLALGNMAGAARDAGALVVVGDDPWSESTQVPADSRFLSQHLYMPVLEPATFQEIKDWVGLAFDLSQETALYLTFLVTSNQAEGGGTVELAPNRRPALNRHNRTTIDTGQICSADRVIIPPATNAKEQDILDRRFPLLLERAEAVGINRIQPGRESSIGLITSGLAFTYLEHAIDLLGRTGSYSILKLGITYPVDEELVAAFCAGLDHVCVVEEKRPFVEPQIASALSRRPELSTSLWGKQFPDGQSGFPEAMGLHPTLTAESLIRFLKGIRANPIPVLQTTGVERSTVRVPPRTPSFCPGCPHRDSASVLKRTATDFTDPDYMRSRGGRTTDLVFHGDIGCYSMLKYAPFSRLMHNLSGMGLGGATGAGIDPFIDNKQLVFMGDSTFFHTGMTAISDSIKNGQDLTYVILDNKSTAMTGHQPTPGLGVDILGRPTTAQDIEQAVRGLGGQQLPVHRIDPSNRQAYKELIEATLLQPGVKVVIADKECGITAQRRERATAAAIVAERGFLPVEEHVNISEEVCEYCLECTKGTGCSGLTVNQTTNYGPKIAIDLSTCVTDGACTRVEVDQGDKTCPSFEEIEISRRQAPLVELPEIALAAMPEPPRRKLDGVWYAYIAGVGGMGINLVSSLLGQAGMRQGYEVRLTNKKGLAIRNGSVYSHLSFAPKDRILSPLVPHGEADLLLGLDLLEAARGIDDSERSCAGSTTRTAAIVNTAKTPTVKTLIGEEDFSPEQIGELIRSRTRAEAYLGIDLFRVSETYLGNKLYANVMMIGASYQRGLLPLDLECLQEAMKVSVRQNYETNMKAFQIGRALAIDSQPFGVEPPAASCEALVEEKAGRLAISRGSRLAAEYRSRVAQSMQQLQLDEPTARHLALSTYDLINYEGPTYAERYLGMLETLHCRDDAERGCRVTRAAVYNLAKVLLIKDEVYVAHLLTCPEKYERDRRRYNVDPARGDRIRYIHLTRPHFRLFGRDFRPDLKTRDWQLRLLRRMRFLRRLLASWWHREERDFTAWYESLVSGFDAARACADSEYETWVELLSLPESVRGYRSVRSAAMTAARRRGGELTAILERGATYRESNTALAPELTPEATP